MKKTVSLIFPTNEALSEFRSIIAQPNCVAVGTLLSCDLTKEQVKLAKEYGARILADPEKDKTNYSFAVTSFM